MKLLALSLLLLTVQGCAVIAVADAVVSVGATVVKTGAKAAGAVVGAIIPDGDSEKK
jgi:hypothetical protein